LPPGLGELAALVAQAAGAGVEVRVALEGRPRRLPAAVDLAAYRGVQGSLTKGARPAAASRAEVTVTHGDDEVVVEVTDDGRGAAVDEGLESASGRQPAHPDRRSRRRGRSGQA